jgi:hypothetical protein
VNLGVGRILELLGNEILAGVFRQNRFSPADGTRHAFGGGREDHLGSQGLQQAAALDRHAFGHRHRQLVAAGGADIGQADARIAGGGLDERDAGLDLAVALGRIDHRAGDAVLDAPQRVHVFEFGQHRGHAAFGHFAKLHQRRVADARRNVLLDSSGQTSGGHAMFLILRE